MGKSRRRDHTSSVAGSGATVILSSFPSPSPSSSSSSDFEFTVSLSPSSRRSAAQQCPADELFYKGKLLPLHLSPRISMVRTLLLASSSSSSSDGTTTTASRSSTSSSDCDSSRPSSATDDDLSRLNVIPPQSRRNNYFTSFATRFSNVFHKKPTINTADSEISTAIPVSKKTTKQVIKKYVKKMRPIYEKLSSQKLQTQPQQKKTFSFSIRKDRNENVGSLKKEHVYSHNHSFSGNLRFPKRNRCAGSCPSSMRSSPTHSGLLYTKPVDGGSGGGVSGASSSMEELQSAIQGAIAHCKSTMGQAKIR